MTEQRKQLFKLAFAMVFTVMGIGLAVGLSTLLVVPLQSCTKTTASVSSPADLEAGMDKTEYIFDKELEMCFLRMKEAYGNAAYGYLTHVPCTEKFMAKAQPKVLQ